VAMTSLRMITLSLSLVLAGPSRAAAVEVGTLVDDVELPALAGGKAHLLARGAVNVLIFVKPGHQHCVETLRDLAAREGKVAGARWIAVLPGDTSAADARGLASSTGVKMPMVLDVGDALYGRLEVKLQPTIVIVDRQGRIAGYEPFREINYGDRVTARIRFTLGEISAAQLAQAEDPARSETHSDQGMAKSRVQFGQKLMDMGQLDMALAEVGKSLAQTPTSVAYLLQGKILSRQGKCEEATRSYEMALQLEPKNGDVVAEKSRPCPPKKGMP
jgi:tetratricopeptide (TPR) repeat protein